MLQNCDKNRVMEVCGIIGELGRRGHGVTNVTRECQKFDASVKKLTRSAHVHVCPKVQ